MARQVQRCTPHTSARADHEGGPPTHSRNLETKVEAAAQTHTVAATYTQGSHTVGIKGRPIHDNHESKDGGNETSWAK